MATELGSADAKWTGGGAKEFLGWNLTASGEIDGDGCADVLVSAPQDPLANANAGSPNGGGVTYLISGASMYPSDCSGDSIEASFYSNTTGDASGYSLSFTDTDGDGLSEVLIGAPDADLGAGTNSGATYLAYGDTSGDTELGTDMVTFAGESYYDRSGWAIAGNGDINGDGYDDLLITAEQDDDGGSNAGATYVWLGPVGITEVEYSQADADAKIIGATAGDRSGYSVSYAGDIDGDGNDDVLIGAWKADGDDSASGMAQLLMGPVSGSVSLSDAQANFTGTGASDQAGSVVAGGGDFDNDGVPDMLIGARYNDDADTKAGATYLILGISQ